MSGKPANYGDWRRLKVFMDKLRRVGVKPNAEGNFVMFPQPGSALWGEPAKLSIKVLQAWREQEHTPPFTREAIEQLERGLHFEPDPPALFEQFLAGDSNFRAAWGREQRRISM